MDKRLAAVVILYKPESNLLSNIETYVNEVDLLIVADNSEDNRQSRAMLSNLIMHENTIYIHDGQNKGIGSRLNEALEICNQKGIRLLLAMDQDSHFTTTSFSTYKRCLEVCTPNDIAIYGPQYLKKTISEDLCKFEPVTEMITSGSIFNVEYAIEIGKFDESLFIDLVDFEFCYRSILAKKRIIQFCNIYLDHSLGKLKQSKSLKTFKKTERSLHNPVRLYYMTRNFLRISKTYRRAFPEEINRNRKDLMNRIKNNIIYNSTGKTIQYVFRGIADYLRGKTGKL